MKIVVCVKQVPDTTKLRFDLNGHVSTEGVENILNPCCGYAAEIAVQLKEKTEGATLTAFSVGGGQAKEALKRTVAMGADEAYWLQDPSFDSADAYAIAHVLAKAIQSKVPDADLILLGQFTDDGMSGITGPALAEVLKLPCITLANKLEAVENGKAVVLRDTEDAVEKHALNLPGVICFANSEAEPRIPNIKGVMRANRTEIPVLDAASIAAQEIGSPTAVLTQSRKPQKQGGIKVDGADAQQAVTQLIEFLKAQKVV